MILEKFGDEMENVFEKKQILSVTTYFFKENVEKQPFLRMTTYFFENIFHLISKFLQNHFLFSFSEPQYSFFTFFSHFFIFFYIIFTFFLYFSANLIKKDTFNRHNGGVGGSRQRKNLAVAKKPRQSLCLHDDHYASTTTI